MRSRIIVRNALLVNAAVLIFVLVLVGVFYTPENRYIRFGPSDTLSIASIAIDNWTSYAILVLVIIAINVGETIVHEFGDPILDSIIYDPTHTQIAEFSRSEVELFANLSFLVTDIKSIFLILVSVAQVDIALWSVLVSRIVGFFAIRILLDAKEFNTEGSSEEKVELSTRKSRGVSIQKLRNLR